MRVTSYKNLCPRYAMMLMTLMLGFMITGCQTVKPIRTVNSVDLKRFMGDWYVVANIPTFIEKDAFNAIESYRLNTDGTVATTFSFNKSGFEGPRKVYHFKGFIEDDPSKAVWKMQFIWPLRAEYRIIYINENYSQTVIGRSKRDYVWVMARTPSIPNDEYQELLKLLAEQGYDIAKIQKIRHKQNTGG